MTVTSTVGELKLFSNAKDGFPCLSLMKSRINNVLKILLIPVKKSVRMSIKNIKYSIRSCNVRYFQKKK